MGGGLRVLTMNQTKRRREGEREGKKGKRGEEQRKKEEQKNEEITKIRK